MQMIITPIEAIASDSHSCSGKKSTYGVRARFCACILWLGASIKRAFAVELDVVLNAHIFDHLQLCFDIVDMAFLIL